MSMPPSVDAMMAMRLALTVDHEREVKLTLDGEPLLDEQALDDLAFRAGLMRDERLAEDLVGRFRRSLDALDDLHTARLATTTCMNLGLDDDDLVAGLVDELLGRRASRLLGRHAGDALRHRNAVLPIELFRLILVNVHGACLLRHSGE